MTDINTHGLKPDPQQRFKLFTVDGFQILCTLAGSDDSEDYSYGIRYTVPLDIPGLEPVSIWIGTSSPDELPDEVCASWDSVFNGIDEEGARKALSGFFEKAGPMAAKLFKASQE